MINRFLNQLLYTSKPLEFSFDIPLKTAIKKLDIKVDTWGFSLIGTGGMYGTVSEKYTRFHRLLPLIQNPLAPVFTGSFSKSGNKTILSGTLHQHEFFRIFLKFLFIILGILVPASLILTLFKPHLFWMLLSISGNLLFLIALIKLGKWLSRNDEKWLIENINNAINLS